MDVQEFDHPFNLLRDKGGFLYSLVQSTGKNTATKLKNDARKINMKIFLLMLCLLLQENLACKVTESEDEGISVICSNITSLAEFSNLGEEEDSVYSLAFEDSNIPILSASVFENFTNLTFLEFRNVNIESIEQGAFSGLNQLKKLVLVQNKLKTLKAGVFSSLSKLKDLNLGDNEINYIENDTFAGLENLQRLILENNKITKIEENLLEPLKNIDLVNLNENPIEILDITEYPNRLRRLRLSKCKLKEIIWFPSTIEAMSMDYNELVILNKSEEIVRDQPVKNAFLDFSHNKINSISANYFWKMKNLIILNLAHNEIEEIDVSLFRDLSNLQVLNLSYNKIKAFSNGTFSNLTKLVSLYLSNNQLADLGQYHLYPLVNLVHLSFEGNQISSFDSEDFVKNMEMLKSVGIISNPWSCQNISRIYQTLRVKGIIIDKSDTFDNDVNQIPCEGPTSSDLQKNE